MDSGPPEKPVPLLDLTLTIGNNCLKLTPDGSTPGEFSLRVDGEQPVPVKVTQERIREGLTFQCYSFEYTIPGSEGIKPNDEVAVEIADTLLVPAQADDTYYLRLTYPTRHLTVEWVFPEGVTTIAHVFGFPEGGPATEPQFAINPSRGPLVQGGNMATVVLEDWSMPGNGAYVGWRLPRDWDERVKAAAKS